MSSKWKRTLAYVGVALLILGLVTNLQAHRFLKQKVSPVQNAPLPLPTVARHVRGNNSASKAPSRQNCSPEERGSDTVEGECKNRTRIVANNTAHAHSTNRVVVVAFFGLLKSFDKDQLLSLRVAVLHPLRSSGYTIRAFLFSSRLESYTNARNGERSTFNQTQSVEVLRQELPDLVAEFEDVEIGQNYVKRRTPQLLRFGNVFEAIKFPDPNVTFGNVCMQLYNLLRLTEMWTNRILLPDAGNSSTTRRIDHLHGVLYLRSDLYFFSKLNMDAFEATVANGNKNMILRNFDVFSSDVATLHPWIAGQRFQETTGGEADSPLLLNSLSPVSDSLRKYPMHISVANIEYGGLSDRFAFGSPDTMMAYGCRLLAVQFAVNSLKKWYHPETTLHEYYCAASSQIHIAPTFFSLRRSHGVLRDPGAPIQREVSRQQLLRWQQWLSTHPLETFGYGNYTSCLVDSFWKPVPFAEAERRQHTTPFQ